MLMRNEKGTEDFKIVPIDLGIKVSNINIILDLLDNKLNLVKCRVVKEPYKNGYVEKIYYEINTKIHLKDR